MNPKSRVRMIDIEFTVKLKPFPISANDPENELVRETFDELESALSDFLDMESMSVSVNVYSGMVDAAVAKIVDDHLADLSSIKTAMPDPRGEPEFDMDGTHFVAPEPEPKPVERDQMGIDIDLMFGDLLPKLRDFAVMSKRSRAEFSHYLTDAIDEYRRHFNANPDSDVDERIVDAFDRIDKYLTAAMLGQSTAIPLWVSIWNDVYSTATERPE